MKMKMIGAAALVVVSGIGVPAPGNSATIDFNNFISPTNNDLVNNFVQGPPFGGSSTPPYQQSPTGGITGGSVTGYSGQNYFATAVYQQIPQSFSSIGTTISLSMDFYYNGAFVPLGPGANAVRSFRLGLLDSSNGTFETVGDPSLYVEGLYSLSLNQMVLVLYSNTDSVSQNIEAAQITLQPDQWLQLDGNFTEVGAEDYTISTSLYDLGSDGLAPPTLLGLGSYLENGGVDPTLTAGSYTFSNPDMANPTYVGFSVLADGGIAKGDNLVVPGNASAVPELPTWTLMMLGFCGLGYATRHRRRLRWRRLVG
jgi:hypothetical protein